VDLTKYLEEHQFVFDEVFDDTISNEQLYLEAVQPLVEAAFTGVKVTCFAYGQTGSGKTYTMMGAKRKLDLSPECSYWPQARYSAKLRKMDGICVSA